MTLFSYFIILNLLVIVASGCFLKDADRGVRSFSSYSITYDIVKQLCCLLSYLAGVSVLLKFGDVSWIQNISTTVPFLFWVVWAGTAFIAASLFIDSVCFYTDKPISTVLMESVFIGAIYSVIFCCVVKVIPYTIEFLRVLNNL